MKSVSFNVSVKVGNVLSIVTRIQIAKSNVEARDSRTRPYKPSILTWTILLESFIKEISWIVLITVHAMFIVLMVAPNVLIILCAILKISMKSTSSWKSYLLNNFLIINVPGLNFPCVNFLKLKSCILHRDESIWLTAWTLSCTVVDCLVVRSNRCNEGLNANPDENEVGGPSSRKKLFP